MSVRIIWGCDSEHSWSAREPVSQLVSSLSVSYHHDSKSRRVASRESLSKLGGGMSAGRGPEVSGALEHNSGRDRVIVERCSVPQKGSLSAVSLEKNQCKSEQQFSSSVDRGGSNSRSMSEKRELVVQSVVENLNKTKSF